MLVDRYVEGMPGGLEEFMEGGRRVALLVGLEEFMEGGVAGRSERREVGNF